ncbi:MAG: hypothetical protein AAFV87_02785 [Pseudomonadota bacterium]
MIEGRGARSTACGLGLNLIACGAILSGAAAWAGMCELEQICREETACNPATLILEWDGSKPTHFEVNGVTMDATHDEGREEIGEIKTAQGTWTVGVNKDTIRLSNRSSIGWISPGEEEETVSFWTMKRVSQYLDYADALEKLVTYRGVCEELF